MKATPALLHALRGAIVPLDTPERRTAYLAAGLTDMRYRWDLLHASRIPPSVYYAGGITDAHVDTALRAIVPTLANTQKVTP